MFCGEERTLILQRLSLERKDRRGQQGWPWLLGCKVGQRTALGEHPTNVAYDNWGPGSLGEGRSERAAWGAGKSKASPAVPWCPSPGWHEIKHVRCFATKHSCCPFFSSPQGFEGKVVSALASSRWSPSLPRGSSLPPPTPPHPPQTQPRCLSLWVELVQGEQERRRMSGLAF